MHQLTPEIIALITLELNKLELNEVNGWDKLYPNLYAMLHKIVTTSTKKSRWGIPNIGILFKGIGSDSIQGYCLSNGTMQINFGSNLLRNVLLKEASLEDAPLDIDAAYVELTTTTQQAITRTCEEMVSNAAIELSAHEKNIVNNWNILYPHLFTMLNKIVAPICLKTGRAITPALAILFANSQRYNAWAQILPNETQQLSIGSELIRALVFRSIQENDDEPLRQFQWIIAHEIGHFCDPAFQKYAQFSSAFIVLNYTSQLIVMAGTTALLLPMLFAANITALAPSLILAGCLGLLAHQLVLILLHRRFEYVADKTSTNLLEKFTPHDAHTALTFMNENIAQDLFCYLPIPGLASNSILKTSLTIALKIYKKIIWAYNTRLHPSTESRVNKLKKHITKHI